jgi:hypothetical protein
MYMPPTTLNIYLTIVPDLTFIYVTDGKESFGLRKLQRGLMEKWCERRNKKDQ